MHAWPTKQKSRGFTLVELMVAISILALIAVLSWRGLDGMMRAQSSTQTRSDAIVASQSTLGQWRADLDAMIQVSNLRPLDWDGQVLRITRRNVTAPAEGMLVVGWSTRIVDGQLQWLRWQSPALTLRGDVQAAWAQAAAWARTPSAQDMSQEVVMGPVVDWQVYFYRGNAWSSPFSSVGGLPGASILPTDVSMPDGVRLLLTLPPAHPLAGQMTLDWVRPTLSGGKS